MGLIHSCIGKRRNKVGIISEDETDAYGKIEHEMEKELIEDAMLNKPFPCVMSSAAEHETESIDTAEYYQISDYVKTTDGLAFDIYFKPALAIPPPIKISALKILPEEYEMLKGEILSLLREKQERARRKRRKVLRKKILVAKKVKGIRFREELDIRFI